MIVVRVHIACLMLALMLGCSQRGLDPGAYRSWIEANDCPLRTTFETGDWVWSVLYKPADYVALIEWGDGGLDFDSLRTRFSDQQHYNLRIQHKVFGGDLLTLGTEGDKMEFNRRLRYCLSQMQSDIYVEESGTRYPCRFLHMIRTHGLQPGLSFIMSFERSDKEWQALPEGKEPDYVDKTVVIEDGLFGSGRIHMVVSGEEIKKRPRLQI